MKISPRIKSLEAILAGAQLPALPQSAVRLLELSQDPHNGPEQFGIPIEADPGLTSQVLRFVNSSYFGFRQEISSIKHAISLVGIRTIKNFVLWSAVFSVMPNPKCGPFNLKNLWQDSLRRGIFARGLARILKLPDAEELFAIGLLQDMAVPLLARELPEAYVTLLTAREGGIHRLSDLELEELGWSHAQAGAMLARGWNLPDLFASAIERHVGSELGFSPAISPGSQVIQLSSLLPSTCDAEWPEQSAFLQGFAGIGESRALVAVDVLRQADQEFADFAPFLKLPQPERSLADYLVPATEPAVAGS